MAITTFGGYVTKTCVLTYFEISNPSYLIQNEFPGVHKAFTLVGSLIFMAAALHGIVHICIAIYNWDKLTKVTRFMVAWLLMAMPLYGYLQYQA